MIPASSDVDLGDPSSLPSVGYRYPESYHNSWSLRLKVWWWDHSESTKPIIVIAISGSRPVTTVTTSETTISITPSLTTESYSTRKTTTFSPTKTTFGSTTTTTATPGSTTSTIQTSSANSTASSVTYMFNHNDATISF
ncbi:unnamed protein product [Enterobius vermicularis]|uniref:REJ domain-containing protein n=1 Tax=Enterobius vermicularis TaxID=51028 RepID=A0A0N4VJ78_ENTVE|nr:unnamed protein product [Enterobius vermicularis]